MAGSTSSVHRLVARAVMTGIRISRATMRKITQNLFWVFIYNIQCAA